MSSLAGKYPMKAVARLTGLNPDTIRAWERRYGAITPGRTDGAHRLYSEADVERLKLLREVTEAGHGIGRVAGLADEALRALLPARAGVSEAGGTDVVERVLAAVERYDLLAAEKEVSRLAALLPPRQVVIEVAWPLLREVGERWCDGRFSVGQEHLVSGLLRSLLGALLRLTEPPAGRSPIVLATLSGERHELGALMVALLAASAGVPICYLGPDTPVADLVTAARKTGAAAVGLSFVREGDAEAIGRALRELAAGLAPGTALWIGGQAAEKLPASVLPEGARRLLTLEALDAALAALAGRGARV